MHAAAWLAWAVMVMVVALVTTNPFYLCLLVLCVLLVAAVAPASETGLASFRFMLTLGVGLLVVSVGVATINGSYGEHVLFTVPGPDLPSWVGGLRLGGPVTGEALVAAAIRGVAILCVFLAFAVLNGAVSPYRMLRLGPAAVFHAGLVVTVGLALLPSTIEDLRRLREARTLRGGSAGIRDIPALAVPAVIGGLERATRLAEAMEARGFASHSPLPLGARLAGIAAVPLALVSGWTWLYAGNLRGIAILGMLFAAGCVFYWGWRAARARNMTRLREEPFPVADRLLAAGAGVIAFVAIAGRATGWVDLTYNPFAGLPSPAFELLPAALVLLAAWPVGRLLFVAPTAKAPVSEPTKVPEGVQT
jgi:energy-coupling factor transport system permease protein